MARFNEAISYVGRFLRWEILLAFLKGALVILVKIGVIVLTIVVVPLLLSLGLFLVQRSCAPWLFRIARVIKWILIVPAWLIWNMCVYYAIFGNIATAFGTDAVTLMVYGLVCFFVNRNRYQCNWQTTQACLQGSDAIGSWLVWIFDVIS